MPAWHHLLLPAASSPIDRGGGERALAEQDCADEIHLPPVCIALPWARWGGRRGPKPHGAGVLRAARPSFAVAQLSSRVLCAAHQRLCSRWFRRLRRPSPPHRWPSPPRRPPPPLLALVPATAPPKSCGYQALRPSPPRLTLDPATAPPDEIGRAHV